MTIVIDLKPEEESRLHDRAAQYGQDIAGYLKAVARWEAEAAGLDRLDQEELAAIRVGIRRGLEEEAAGKVRPLEEFIQEQRIKHGLPIP